MSGSTRRWIVSTVPVAILVAASVVGAATVRAQDATPGAMVGMGEPHPGHIHSGTCAELGDVVYPLADAVAVATMATPSVASDGPRGSVAISVSTVEASLDDILAAEHAINFHESAENIGNYIACGDITGTPTDDTLNIELAELNDSGYAGVAALEDLGDGTTLVTVELTAADDTGTPVAGGMEEMAEDIDVEATPAPDDDDTAGEENAAVDIADFAYDPAEITVAVGDTVTWTNTDPVPHTATADDRDVLQSGTIDAGASYEQTFDAAGSYDYFCEFHPDMAGTVVVE